MAIAGILVTLLGFVVAVASLGITSSAGGRLGIVIVGLIISIAGILGILNPAYQKNAVWKK
jgi:hypothetical protein